MDQFILLEEILKFAISIIIFVPFISVELRAMIGHNLANGCQPAKSIQSLLEKFDAVFCGLRIEFATGKNAPRAVIKDHTNLFAIEFADMPIEMHQA